MKWRLQIIIKGKYMATKIKISHPGKLLQKEFMKPYKISSYKLAKAISVPLTRITDIINSKRSISAETALLLARYFGTSEQFFLNMQAHYDMEIAKDTLEANNRLTSIPFGLASS